MIEDYLRALAARLPETQRGRVLAEAEDHLREAAAALVADGVDPAAAEAAAVRAFGSADEVARRVAPLLAAVAVRRAAVVGILVSAALVLPLYGIPENTLPPATWDVRPQLLSTLINGGIASWVAAMALAAAALFVARPRPRVSAALLAGSACATLAACFAGVAGLLAWRAEAGVALGWQPFLVVPVALAAASLALVAAVWARDRARLATSNVGLDRST